MSEEIVETVVGLCSVGLEHPKTSTNKKKMCEWYKSAEWSTEKMCEWYKSSDWSTKKTCEWNKSFEWSAEKMCKW